MKYIKQLPTTISFLAGSGSPSRPRVAKVQTLSHSGLIVRDADSTVLAHLMTLLNKRYDYGLELFLLSIDEGITGYRDDSLEVHLILED